MMPRDDFHLVPDTNCAIEWLNTIAEVKEGQGITTNSEGAPEVTGKSPWAETITNAGETCLGSASFTQGTTNAAFRKINAFLTWQSPKEEEVLSSVHQEIESLISKGRSCEEALAGALQGADTNPDLDSLVEKAKSQSLTLKTCATAIRTAKEGLNRICRRDTSEAVAQKAKTIQSTDLALLEELSSSLAELAQQGLQRLQEQGLQRLQEHTQIEGKDALQSEMVGSEEPSNHSPSPQEREALPKPEVGETEAVQVEGQRPSPSQQLPEAEPSPQKTPQKDRVASPIKVVSVVHDSKIQEVDKLGDEDVKQLFKVCAERIRKSGGQAKRDATLNHLLKIAERVTKDIEAIGPADERKAQMQTPKYREANAFRIAGTLRAKDPAAHRFVIKHTEQ